MVIDLVACSSKLRIISTEERNRLTLEALTDIDEGRVIDHQAVLHATDTPEPPLDSAGNLFPVLN